MPQRSAFIARGAAAWAASLGAGLVVVAAVVLTGCASAPRPEAASIDALVASEMSRQRIPGIAVGVVRRGQVLLANGHGLANVEHEVPVTTSTVFQAGSLGKQFAAVAAMLLVEDGRLSLDGSITRFFTDAPASWQPITVRHLLTHTSGIPNFADGVMDMRRDYSEDELARLAFELPLAFPAGSRWEYSDTGYVLLGIVVGRASGRFYGDVLRDRVFGPLGMAGARVISEETIVMHRAAGYLRADGQLRNQAWVAPSLNTTADGSLYLSLDDWLRWEQALRRRAVLQPGSWTQVFTPVRLTDGGTFPYGFGWALNDGPGPAWYRHEGAWQGFKAAYLHAVDADLTVIVLCNLAEAEPMRLAERIARVLVAGLVFPEPGG
jgi:CubicO group peptidase (beta-lactamase class C family)